MSTEYVTVRNLLTGGVSRMRRSHAEHSLFGANLEIVPPGTKKKVLIPKRLTEPAIDPVDTGFVEDKEEEGESPDELSEKVKNG